MSLMFAIGVGVIFWFLSLTLYFFLTSEPYALPPSLLEDDYDEAVERSRY